MIIEIERKNIKRGKIKELLKTFETMHNFILFEIHSLSYKLKVKSYVISLHNLL